MPYERAILVKALNDYEAAAPLSEEELKQYVAKMNSPVSEEAAESLKALAGLVSALLEWEKEAVTKSVVEKGEEKKPDIDKMRELYSNEMDEVFKAKSSLLSSAHRDALIKLHELLIVKADTRRADDPYSESLIALDRFNNYVENQMTLSKGEEAIAAAARAATVRGRKLELEQRQNALTTALNNFLENPNEHEYQEKLAKQLAWFQGCVLKQEQVRLAEEEGIKKSMTGADDRATPLVANLDLLSIDRSHFQAKHVEVLESLFTSLLHKATGEKDDPITQQASAVQFFMSYVEKVIHERKELEDETHEPEDLEGQTGETKQRSFNYFLAGVFSSFSLGLISLVFSLTLPLLAPSLGFGLVLAPPMALSLAAASALLVPVTTFLMAAALRAASQSKGFWQGVKGLGQKLVESFHSTSVDVEVRFEEPSTEGSLNATGVSIRRNLDQPYLPANREGKEKLSHLARALKASEEPEDKEKPSNLHY